MDRRLLMLLIAGAVIASLTLWRVTRPPRPAPQMGEAPTVQSGEIAIPPSFELPDQQGNLVKFERYRSRQGVVVVFFRADLPASADPSLDWLRKHYDSVKKAGYEVIGISTQTGATIRNSADKEGQDWPFPMLNDIHLRSPEPAPVHHLWQMIDATTGELKQGTILVDQSGHTSYLNGSPRPLDQPLVELKQLFASDEP
ncbi:MAG: redoxin domain-containing protein [Planctomycetaceae bacterium]